jgi:hypothetical protein
MSLRDMEAPKGIPTGSLKTLIFVIHAGPGFNPDESGLNLKPNTGSVGELILLQCQSLPKATQIIGSQKLGSITESCNVRGSAIVEEMAGDAFSG